MGIHPLNTVSHDCRNGAEPITSTTNHAPTTGTSIACAIAAAISAATITAIVTAT